MPPNHHEPFKSLGPLAWEDIEAKENDSTLSDLLTSTFHDAQILIDSIPAPATTPITSATSGSITTTSSGGGGGRARSKTESAAVISSSATATALIPPSLSHSKNNTQDSAVTAETITRLQREWKEVKTNPKDNPLGISIYKLASKDSKGSWFARRSVHYASASDSGGPLLSLSFDKWRCALEREFAETLNRSDKNGKNEPGTGNIRGIGAERRVERRVVDGSGSLEMFQVSARFPGPTTPRDFITLLLMSPTTPPNTTSDEQKDPDEEKEKKKEKEKRPRQFMLVSRPCTHPDCPPRRGFIRGEYESVEVIREVPITTEKKNKNKKNDLRRTRSSVDLSRSDLKVPFLQMEKGLVASGLVVEPPVRPSSAIDSDKKVHEELGDIDEEEGEDEEEDAEMAIEWLMVTRSDPGGSVPRFMVEKGTPGGITNDANKFIRWLSSTISEELLADGSKKKALGGKTNDRLEGEKDVGKNEEGTGLNHETTQAGERGQQKTSTGKIHTQEQTTPPTRSFQTSTSAPQGFYGMISGALGAATSVVANTIGAFTGGLARGTDSEINTDSSDSDGEEEEDINTDSEDGGYVSAEDWGDETTTTTSPSLANKTKAHVATLKPDHGHGNDDKTSTRSTRSATLSSTTSSTLQTTPPSISAATTKSNKRASTISGQHEKELAKLQERRKKAEEKLARAQARKKQANNGNNNNNNNDENDNNAEAAAKLLERHEKEMAKQEAKYQRELAKLEEKRKTEERKTEEKRRRQREKEEKANTAMELERVKAERDVARKEIEILKDTVGELQGQNTRLVAILGMHGLLPGDIQDGGSAGSRGSRGSSMASLEVDG